MTDYVLSPFYPVADRLDTSHRAGWARYWAKELGATLLTTKTMEQAYRASRGDRLLLYHGMEWGGQMNLQSGVTDDIKARAIMLLNTKATLLSLDIPMPAYGTLLAKRGCEKGEELQTKLKRQAFMSVPMVDPNRVVMGDSHALSQYTPGSVIYRADGQTLYGALRDGLVERLERWSFETGVALTKVQLTSYFGNIDVRHHLCRHESIPTVTKELVGEYGRQLADVAKTFRARIEVVAPLPIENEARVLPKTGWYKGTPFFGSWADRDAARLHMTNLLRDECKKRGFKLVTHPGHFLNYRSELSFDVMEQPRSVHIRPAEYRLVQEKLGW